MATKKNILDAANAGTGVLDVIATGKLPSEVVQDAQKVQKAEIVQNAQNVQNVQNVQDAQNAPARGRPRKNPEDSERLNLKIPREIKEYLTIAAARASIERRRTVPLTEYLIELVRADMEKHKDE